jgi:hypothetical protein
MTLVNILRTPDQLDLIPSLSNDNKKHIDQMVHFCELGAVSPDYPYLAVTDQKEQKWADNMHYIRTGEMIHSGIRSLRNSAGEAQTKGFVWLLGYSAHVATDVTIHPIVQMKVGDYNHHPKEHRICEMNQDVYIYQRGLNKSGLDVAQHLKTGIALCHDPENHDHLLNLA